MADLKRQMDALTQSASPRAAEQSMKDVGRRMREAGKPMHALGDQMGALGKRMGEESRAAEKTIHTLIHEAQANGLAQPAPKT
jgi:hypothetical protein